MVRQEEGTTRMLSGYQLGLGGDPCVVVLRRKDGTVVARFTHNVDPEEVRRPPKKISEELAKLTEGSPLSYSPNLVGGVFSEISIPNYR